MPLRRAIWACVSTNEQESGNQIPELRKWACRRSLEIAAEYVDGEGVPQLYISGDSGTITLNRLAER